MENGNIQATTPQKSVEPTAKATKKAKNPKIALIIIAGIILGLGSWGVYASGVKSGKDQAAKDAKTAAEQRLAANPVLALPSSGTVSKISGKEVTIKLLGTETKSGKIDSKTQVSGKAGKATVKDIKEGDRIVLFTKKSGKDDIATRIIIQ